MLIAALTWALAYVLALRLSGARPWLVWLATLAVALSATAYIYSSEVYPEIPAGLALVGALLVVTGRERLSPTRGAHAARDALAPGDERHAALGLGEVAVPADAAALAVVGGHHHRGAVEVAVVAAPAEELLQQPVGRLDALEVLGVVAAARVARLIDGQRLQDEQLGVVTLEDLARAGDEGVVDLLVRRDGGDRLHGLLAEGVDEVRDAGQAAAQSRAAPARRRSTRTSRRARGRSCCACRARAGSRP